MALYAYTSTAQTVPAEGLVVLAQAVRRGHSASLTGTGITLNRPNSFYIVSASVRGTTTAAGELGITAQLDGVAIPAARGSQTVAAAGDQANVAIEFGIATDDFACCNPPTVTFVNSGVASILESIAVTVQRMD